MGIRELKQNASAVIRRVKQGEPLTITERGVPVAKLVPIPDDKYIELIQEGVIIPGLGGFDVDSIVPIEIPGGISSEELIAQEREERLP